MDDYEGPERRKPSALEETRTELAFTRRSLDQLVEALGTVKPADIRRDVRTLLVALGALFITLLTTMIILVAHIDAHTDQATAEEKCLLRLSPEQRTIQAVIACQNAKP